MAAASAHDHQQVQLHQHATHNNTDEAHTKQKEEEEEQQVPIKTTKARKLRWWWAKVGICAAVIIVCQSASVLLARLYFMKGGASKWLSTISQAGGFPILIPYYIYANYFNRPRNRNRNQNDDGGHLPAWAYGAFYVVQGCMVFGTTYLYTVGLDYLPVSTSTLIASSQLGFNAFFSYFINSQIFTPFITNSLFLLTLSSVLLVFGTQGEAGGGPSSSSKGEYVLGFICTVGAAAGFGLYMSVAEYAFRKARVASFRAVVGLLMFQGMVASGLGLVALFASGDWKGLRKEMEGYELGEVAYVMTVTWTAVLAQLFAVGTLGLVFEVSSVFSNAVVTVGLPLTPLLAVAIFHDGMNGVKAVAMVLAVWGFVSYLYQQYLDGWKTSTSSSRDGVDVVEGSNGAV